MHMISGIRAAGMSILFLSMCIAALSAQRFTHRQYRHNWHDHLPIDVPVSPVFAEYDAVILYDEVLISLINPTFKRYFRIKFRTKESILAFNDFVLPNSVDPYLFRYSYPQEKQDTGYYPLLKDEEINYFDARIIRNGELVKAVLDEKIYTYPIHEGYNVLNYHAFRYHVRNLQPGDELEVSYSHKLPPVTRYFFQDRLPKQECRVSILTPWSTLYTIKAANLPLEFDTVRTPGYISYGCVLENIWPADPRFNQQSYTGLPYVEFFIDKYYIGSSSIVQGSAPTLPLRWKNVLYTLAGFRPDDYGYHVSKTDGSTQTYNQVFDEIFSPMKDSSLTWQLQHMQEIFTDSFAYADDWSYYTREHDDLETVKANLGKRVIRQRYRLKTYTEMLYRWDKEYYCAYIPDRRITLLSEKEYRPLLGVHRYFVIRDGNEFHFVMPKHHRFGYYMDEMPFYCSGVPTYLVPQMVSERMFNRTPDDITYPLVYTPAYKPWDNRRTTYTYARVELDSGMVRLSGRVDLAGQFSTMTRGAYLYGYRDSTVNRKYNQLIYQVKDAGLDEVKLLSLSKEYPFSCSIAAVYHSPSLISRASDTTYLLDISGWINPVFHEEFDPKYYHASFFSDFEGEDHFSLGIRFSQKVALLNSADYVYLIRNSFADLRTHISQPEKDFLMIEVSYKIKTDEVPADKIADVGEIYRALMKLSHARLLLGTSNTQN